MRFGVCPRPQVPTWGPGTGSAAQPQTAHTALQQTSPLKRISLDLRTEFAHDYLKGHADKLMVLTQSKEHVQWKGDSGAEATTALAPVGWRKRP